MVQILPPKTSLGAEVGQALGQGIAQGGQQAFQRGVLQQGLAKAQQAYANPNLSPADKALAFINAAAGVPGAEKYIEPMLRILSTQSMYGGGGMGSMQGQGGAMMPQGGAQAPQNLGGGPPQGPLGGGPNYGGYLSPEMGPQQLDAFARNFAQANPLDPNAYAMGLQRAQMLNEQAKANRAEIGSRALALGIPEKDLPDFMKIAQQYGYLQNPEEILTTARREYGAYRRNVDKLESAFFPGVGTSTLDILSGKPIRRALKRETGVGFFTESLTNREKAFKKLEGAVGDLVKMGHEQKAREILGAHQLSPTEIEEIIHPLSKDAATRLESMKGAGNKSPEMRQNELSNFFLNNVKPGDSLLVLRHKLWNDKGYDWEDIGPAIREAQANGLKLSPDQLSEMAEVETRAPNQSLIDIFSDWPNFVKFLAGQK